MSILLILLICYFIYYIYKRKIENIKRLNSEFGEKPKGYHDEFDMSFLKKYYEIRKSNEFEKECVDEITWNDLDMDEVFKRINYSSTTLGEGYLYYKLRQLSDKDNKWKDREKLISSFIENDNLRGKVKLSLLKVGKLNDYRLINFIYNPSFIKINNYYIYPLLLSGLILSILLILLKGSVGIVLTVTFICINIIVYQRAKILLEENFKVMVYILKNIELCKDLLKIKDKDFNKFNNKIKSILDKFTKIRSIKKYRIGLLGESEFLLPDLYLVIEYIKMFFLVDIIAYQNAAKILEKNKEYILLIYDLVGELDFAITIAYYRKSIEEYANPEFVEENIIEIEDIYHPLLDNPIKNSIIIDNNIIFTGSNASGKSTFIKAVALNCIMAQSLNTALCSKYKCRFSKVITSMAIKDNIMEGDSYFIAEVKSLKRLVDSLNGDSPVLAFIDEILKGTNTIERISASASILKYAKTTNSRILVATHDIELTQMIESGYDNYNFSEIITEDNVIFDYKIKHGPSTTRNAIKLLKVMDFDSNIIDEANDIYESFLKNEKWNKV